MKNPTHFHLYILYLLTNPQQNSGTSRNLYKAQAQAFKPKPNDKSQPLSPVANIPQTNLNPTTSIQQLALPHVSSPVILTCNSPAIPTSERLLQVHENVLHRIPVHRVQLRKLRPSGVHAVKRSCKGPFELLPPELALHLPLARELRRDHVLGAARVRVQLRQRV
ncbi:uncharacterized protein A4U43_C09F6640 [Asparagus officinalis]|uniref:Uncharacterized protein n=1 Tax=Asparagus officinalis TaxID=4686 RepID=A0A5P1EAM2_ASPOF|nr:uncharacterized protein A4U43_C09F6640 [Asparagus officinalis]